MNIEDRSYLTLIHGDLNNPGLILRIPMIVTFNAYMKYVKSNEPLIQSHPGGDYRDTAMSVMYVYRNSVTEEDVELVETYKEYLFEELMLYHEQQNLHRS